MSRQIPIIMASSSQAGLELMDVFGIDGIAEHVSRHLSVLDVGRLVRTQRLLGGALPFSCPAWVTSVENTDVAVLGRLVFCAALENACERLRVLCSNAGRGLDFRDRASGKSSLWAAAECGHLPAVRILAECGAEFRTNKYQPYGRSPLWAAASMGHAAVVRELASRGARLDSPDRDGQTAVFIASQRGYPEVVKEIASRGGNLNTANWEGLTPLGAAAGGGGRLQVVREIADSSNRRDDGEWIRSVCTPQVSLGHLNVVRELCACGVTIDVPDRNNHTPLFIAAAGGHETIVSILAEHKALLDWRDHNGHTPLFAAAEQGHLPTVRLLAHLGAHIDAADLDMRTPLWIASARGHISIVRELHERGANTSARDSQGVSALSITEQVGSSIKQTSRKAEYAALQQLLAKD